MKGTLPVIAVIGAAVATAMKTTPTKPTALALSRWTVAVPVRVRRRGDSFVHCHGVASLLARRLCTEPELCRPNESGEGRGALKVCQPDL